MDWLHGASRDIFSWILGIFGAVLAWLFYTVIKRGEQIAAMQQRLEDFPTKLGRLEELLETMRAEAESRGDKIYAHVDQLRRELMAEIRDGDRERERPRTRR